MNQEIDALAVAARAGQNKLGEQALWKAVVNLDVWYFVAVGEGDEVEPLIAVVDGQPKLLIFTDKERAAPIVAQQAARRGAPPPVLHMPVTDALEYCEQLIEHDIDGGHFNDGENAFTTSLTNLVDMGRRYRA